MFVYLPFRFHQEYYFVQNSWKWKPQIPTVTANRGEEEGGEKRLDIYTIITIKVTTNNYLSKSKSIPDTKPRTVCASYYLILTVIL